MPGGGRRAQPEGACAAGARRCPDKPRRRPKQSGSRAVTARGSPRALPRRREGLSSAANSSGLRALPRALVPLNGASGTHRRLCRARRPASSGSHAAPTSAPRQRPRRAGACRTAIAGRCGTERGPPSNTNRRFPTCERMPGHPPGQRPRRGMAGRPPESAIQHRLTPARPLSFRWCRPHLAPGARGTAAAFGTVSHGFPVARPFAPPCEGQTARCAGLDRQLGFPPHPRHRLSLPRPPRRRRGPACPRLPTRPKAPRPSRSAKRLCHGADRRGSCPHRRRPRHSSPHPRQ